MEGKNVIETFIIIEGAGYSRLLIALYYIG